MMKAVAYIAELPVSRIPHRRFGHTVRTVNAISLAWPRLGRTSDTSSAARAPAVITFAVCDRTRVAAELSAVSDSKPSRAV